MHQDSGIRATSPNHAPLARALGLLQAPQDIPGDLSGFTLHDPDRIDRLIRRVHRRHQIARLTGWLWHGDPENKPLLGPSSGIPSTGAVLLATHLGSSLLVPTVSDALGISLNEAGLQMYQAREMLAGAPLNACDHTRSLLGRYSDQALSRAELTSLINHVYACKQCGHALERSRTVDREIQAHLDTRPADASAWSGSARPSPLYSQWLWMPGIAVGAFIVALLIVAGSGLVTRSAPMPLIAVSDTEAHPGWVIMASESEVMAIDLADGERRRILSRPAHDWWNPWIISPSGELAAQWEEATRIDRRVGSIRAFDMQGKLRYLHRWEGQRSRIFSGWLDDRTVLLIERGPVQSRGTGVEPSSETLPMIIAANLETGEERILFRGRLDKATVSPDGTHIALVRPASSRWPGKSVEIRPVGASGLTDPVAVVDHRYLSWTSRMIWSHDGQSLHLALVSEKELLIPRGETGKPREFEELAVARIGTDGSFESYVAPAGSRRWVIPQAVSPDDRSLAVLYNESRDRDGAWYHGTLDLESGDLARHDHGIAGSRWWNSETVWLPGGQGRIIQRVIPQRLGDIEQVSEGEALMLETLQTARDPEPAMIFHDLASLDVRSGEGLALLRWIPDAKMQSDTPEPAANETPEIEQPKAVERASAGQSLFGESALAPTGRHLLLHQAGPDGAARTRLVHRQAWSGTESTRTDASEFSWLPRESVAIGVIPPDSRETQGSRLLFFATDRVSALHERTIDPADIGDDRGLSYRKPAFSPDGKHLAFFVQNERTGEMTLWMNDWKNSSEPVTTWSFDPGFRAQPQLTLTWLGNDQIIFSHATEWENGYPRESSLFRGSLGTSGEFQIDHLKAFRASGRDRGIDLRELDLSADQEQIAIRLRHYTGDDPQEDVQDSILVSPASDLSQGIHITRSGAGEGMTWLEDGDWLVAGIDSRVALMDATGSQIDFLTDRPAAYPVLIDPGEIWYQDQREDGQIMRVRINY